MTFLPQVADSPGITFTWSQSKDVEDRKIEAKIYLHSVPESAALKKDLSVRLSGDGETLVVEHAGKKLVYWRLFSEVEHEGDDIGEGKTLLLAEMIRETKPMHLVVPLTKKKPEIWQQFRSQPVVKAEGPEKLFLSDDTLQAFVEKEVHKMPAFDPEKHHEEEGAAAAEGGEAAGAKPKKGGGKKKGGKKAAAVVEKKDSVDDDDLDALLDEVADELEPENALKPSVTTVVDSYQQDHEDAEDEDDDDDDEEDSSKDHTTTGAVLAAKRSEELRKLKAEFATLKDTEAKITADDKKDESKEQHLARVAIMQKLLAEKSAIRAQHPSIANLISVVKLELTKFLLGHKLIDGIAISNVDMEAAKRADFANVEQEEYANAEEEALSPEEIFQRGHSTLQIRSADAMKEAFHWLRLSALRHNNPFAAVMLHSMYSNMKAPAHGAYFILRRALMQTEKDDGQPEPHTNRLVGEMVAAGAHPFVPVFSLAVHFLQRSAQRGDVQALLGLSHLHYNGTCNTPRAYVSPEVTASFRSIARGNATVQAALDRGCPDAYFAKAGMHLDGEWEHEKNIELAQKYFELLKATDAILASRVKRMFEIAARQGGTNKALSAAGGAKNGADDDEPEAPQLPGSSKPAAPSAVGGGSKTQLKPAGSSSGGARGDTSGLTIVPRPGKGGASGQKRMDAMASADGGDGIGNASNSGRSATSSKGGRGGKKEGNFWQSRFETAAAVGAGTYAVWMVAFPVRLMLLPYFYEVLDHFLGRYLGIGRSRSTRGGMLM